MSAYSLCTDVSLKRKKSKVFIPYAIFLCLLGIAALGGEAWAAAPPAPTNLTATMASSRQINLAWTDNATTETSYYVERSPNGSSSWTVVATLGANITSYQNTGLTQNTRYYYRVRCIAGTTYSSYSNTANTTTATLAAPTSLLASVATSTRITLNWTDNTAYETQYSIERSPNGTGSWTVLGTVATNVTTTTNSGLTAGTAYYYRVRAYDSTNYSAYSNTANQTIRTIAASTGANGAIAPSGTVGVANGSSKAFTMTSNSGYKIATVTVDGSSVATNPTYTFSNITANHTISATFSVQTYTITASAGANGSISPSGSVVVSGGTSTTFRMTPNTGYKIATVTVDGSSVATNPTYTFSNVTTNHTINATFSVNTVTITASAGANGSINPSGAVAVPFGANQPFTITPNANYHISDVSVDLVSVGTPSLYTFPSVTTTHSIVAGFAINTFTINATAGANGSISPSGAYIVNSGTTPTFTATPNAGYHIFDIQVDGSSVGSSPTYTFAPVTANHTISATFSVNTYTISAGAGANGTISPSGAVLVSAGSSTTFTFLPNTGCHVSDVLVDGASVGAPPSYTFPSVTATHSILTSFAVNTYTITAAADSNGLIAPSGPTVVNYGDSRTFTITPNTGYHVSDVLVDGSSVGTPPSYTFPAVVSNHTITASFSNSYEITASADANGTISPSGTVNVTQGTNQTYTITPNANYHISDVLVDGVSVGRVTSYLFSNVAATHSISASFAGDTIITGRTIMSNTAWTLAGSPYIVTGDVYVYGAGSPVLTIEPGVVVKFNNNTGLNIANSPSYPGGLNAVGTASAPIIFTSNDPAPAPGKWKGIRFSEGTVGASSVLDYVTVEYGGGLPPGDVYNYGNIVLFSASPTITNSIIQKSLKAGIYVDGTNSFAVIQNNTIVDNATYGFYDNYGSTGTVVSGNTFSGNGSYPAHIGIKQTASANIYGTNGINAIEVVSGAVTQNLTMKNSGLPYVITTDITVYSSSGPTLTIEPGVTVKFSNDTGLNIANGPGSPGGLNAVGTASAPIIFTSNDPAPAPGKWKGITFQSSLSSVLDYVTVEYGGGLPPGYVYSYGNIALFSASPTITNSIIQKSLKAGIYVDSSSAVITRNTLMNNATYGIYASASPNTKVNSNDIVNNAWYGVYNASAAPQLDAKSNWWGDPSGPHHPAANPSGLGNNVSDYVDFTPWLSASYKIDTIPPTLSVDPVTSPTYTAIQTITGTMELDAVITVTVNTSAVAGPVSYPTPTTWSCTVTGLAPGANTITVTARDAAGNTSSVSPSIWLEIWQDTIVISAVDASMNAINTETAESTTIFFTLNRPAVTTLKIIPEKLGPTGAPIYQASQACAVAGPYFFTWNGQDNTGKTVPDEAYIYILEASDGVKTASYSPPALTGTGTVSCTQSTFNPYKNIPMTITYTMAAGTATTGSRVKISIDWGPENFAIVNNVPYENGTYTFNWDGLDPNGKALDNSAVVTCSAPSLIRANHITTTGDTPLVSGLTADPYALSFSYGQFTRVSYTLSRDSLVTVNLKSRTGATIATLCSNAPQASGTHEIDWNGFDPGDSTGKGLVISGEGAYIISVQATNSVTGSSSTARGLVTVNY